MFKLFSSIRSYSTVYKNVSIHNVYANKNIGENIWVKGWVKSLRKMKQNIFVDISDGSCDHKLQIIVPVDTKPETLTTGASIQAKGYLGTTPKGQLELSAHEVNVTGQCIISQGYPFQPRKSYPPEYVREYLHLRPRTNKFASVLRCRHNATKLIHDYFDSHGYFNIHTPILTSNDCEGAGEIFSVHPENKELLKNMAQENIPLDQAYFNTKTYLTVSGQLHLEAVAHGLCKVYTFGPTFRAENSKSRLHLSEFYMVEAEIAFIDDIQIICDIIEHFIVNISKSLLDKCSEDIGRIQGTEKRDHSWLHKRFTIMTYDDAINFLKKNVDKLNSPVQKELGFTKEHEILLVELNGGVPIFVINWPKTGKPFYMKRCPHDNTKVSALDLLAPHIGEIIGGSLREHDFDTLKANLPPGKKELNWYLDLRKFGSVPSAGFGMGFERYLQMLLGINNIKDTIPFPRSPHNCQL